MNVEHHRKEAKRLLREYRSRAPEAVARVDAALGERAKTRFQLSDAQYLVAREAGYRSWPELRRAAGDVAPKRTVIVDTGLEYRPGDPVLVQVGRPGWRRQGVAAHVTDAGAAVAKAGRPAGWEAAVERVQQEIVVNISRQGVVSLPVVAVGPPEEEIVQRIGEASLALYQEILDLEEPS